MVIDKKYQVPKIIASHEVVPIWLRIALLLSLIIGVGWLGYQMAVPDLTGGIVGFSPFKEKRLRDLTEERDELRRQVKMVQQEAEMDQVALRSVKEQIKQFQDERLEMEEELTFLRGIVSDGSNKTGLRVQKFKLQPGLEAGQFNYQFSVSQVISSDTQAKGRINISLEGLQDGQAAVLGLKELTKEKLRSHKMLFRFFQNVEGTLKLPTGFSPAKMIIELQPDDKKLDKVTAIYDWPQ
jgi:hypothetical protein